MDRAAVVRLHQATLKQTKDHSQPQKRPRLRETIIEESKESKQLRESKERRENKIHVLKSPPNGRYFNEVKINKDAFRFIPRQPMSADDVLTRIRAVTPYGLNAKEWSQLTERFVSEPRSNFIFWDNCEPEVLREVLDHFYRCDALIGTNSFYIENWRNASTAYKFILNVIGRYEFNNVDNWRSPGKPSENEYEHDREVLEPKQEIKSGLAFQNDGTFIENKEISQWAKRMITNLDKNVFF